MRPTLPLLALLLSSAAVPAPAFAQDAMTTATAAADIDYPDTRRMDLV